VLVSREDCFRKLSAGLLFFPQCGIIDEGSRVRDVVNFRRADQTKVVFKNADKRSAIGFLENALAMLLTVDELPNVAPVV